MENLKWEVDQKEREIQSLKQQLDLTEHQSKQELDGIQHRLLLILIFQSLVQIFLDKHQNLH